MGCTGRYAEIADFALFWGGCQEDLLDPAIAADIEAQLDLAASDIWLSLAATGACDCTLSSYGTEWLKKLNIVNAAVTYNCGCKKMGIDDRRLWLEWLDKQLEMLRTGEIDPCQDETGSKTPAWGSIQIGWTEANRERILEDTLRRSRG